LTPHIASFEQGDYPDLPFLPRLPFSNFFQGSTLVLRFSLQGWDEHRDASTKYTKSTGGGGGADLLHFKVAHRRLTGRFGKSIHRESRCHVYYVYLKKFYSCVWEAMTLQN
jgi:hypothetical protein